MSPDDLPISVDDAIAQLEAARNRDVRNGGLFVDRVLSELRDERISFLKGWLAGQGVVD